MNRKRDDTRDRLFTAAAELIGERGFHGTTVDDIVLRAGVAKGTVYYHFRSKAELFDGLLTERFTRLADALVAAEEHAADPADALCGLVHAELEYISLNQATAKVLMSELWRSDRAWRDTLRILRERHRTVIERVLASGVRSGAFRPDLDCPLAASVLFAAVATAALDWLVFDPDRPMAEIESAVVDLVLGGVRA